MREIQATEEVASGNQLKTTFQKNHSFLDPVLTKAKPWIVFVLIGILLVIAIQDYYRIENLERAVVGLEYGHPPSPP